MVNLICIGFNKSFGMFFVEFQEKFDTSASRTSVLSAVHHAVNSVSGMFERIID